MQTFAATPYLPFLSLSFWMTSCAPPSTMDVEDTTTSLAFCWNSSMEEEPQEHIVAFTFAREVSTPSLREPAYGT